MEKTRRYLIEVKDIETGAPVLAAAAAWDAQDKRVALLHIMRLAGAPLIGTSWTWRHRNRRRAAARTTSAGTWPAGAGRLD